MQMLVGEESGRTRQLVWVIHQDVDYQGRPRMSAAKGCAMTKDCFDFQRSVCSTYKALRQSVSWVSIAGEHHLHDTGHMVHIHLNNRVDTERPIQNPGLLHSLASDS